MKKVLEFVIIILCTFLFVTGCGKKKTTNIDEQKPITNTNENVIKDQTVEEFQFTDTSMIYEDGVTKFEVTVTNTGSETVNLVEFKIHVKDKEGNEMLEPVLVGYIGEQLNAQESRVMNTYSVKDLTKAYSVEYEIVR